MKRDLVAGKTEGMNRRQLLGGGAALVGGAVIATAIQPKQVFGETKSSRGATPATPPNLGSAGGPGAGRKASRLSGWKDDGVSGDSLRRGGAV